MLALALTLTVLAAPPRGFPAAHSVELITQVETRLPKWLTGGGDRAALLATPKELKDFFRSAGTEAAALDEQVAEALKSQARPAFPEFTANRAIIEFAGHRTTLNFFDEGGRRCEVPLIDIGTEKAPRYLLAGGPLVDTRPIEAVVKNAKAAMAVYLEKKDGAWSTLSMPAPPPPDCISVLNVAAKTIFTAERAYFAEKDAYSNSLTKVGVDVKSLGITSAKVHVAGAAPQQTFTAEVGLRGGTVSINQKGELSVISPCSP